jgi:hypothetical protein
LATTGASAPPRAKISLKPDLLDRRLSTAACRSPARPLAARLNSISKNSVPGTEG